jgi:hypothetical protein
MITLDGLCGICGGEGDLPPVGITPHGTTDGHSGTLGVCKECLTLADDKLARRGRKVLRSIQSSSLLLA